MSRKLALLIGSVSILTSVSFSPVYAVGELCGTNLPNCSSGQTCQNINVNGIGRCTPPAGTKTCRADADCSLAKTGSSNLTCQNTGSLGSGIGSCQPAATQPSGTGNTPQNQPACAPGFHELDIASGGGCVQDAPTQPATTAPGQTSIGASQQTQSDNQCTFDLKNALSFLNPLKLIPCLIKGIVSGIAVAAIAFAISLINFALAINANIGDSHSLARVGFDVSLQITNLLFVVGIIIIAFGTMLRRSFGATLIPRFIMIAVLIYFGFWAVTTAISVSDKVAQVFLDGASKSISWSSLGNFLSSLSSAEPSLGGAIGATVENWASMFISIAFLFISALTLIAIAVMYLIRYVYLTLLIILLPFALFLGIFPMLSAGGAGSLWGKWTENFTKWLIFGPVMAFFLYLSFAFQASYQPSATSNFTTQMGHIADYVTFILFLLLGLIAANQLGVSGAGYFNKAANGGINWGINKGKSWAQRNALRATTRPFRGAGGKSLTQRMQAWQPINVPLPFGLRVKSGLGVGAVGTAISRYAQRGEDLVKTSGKEIEGLSSDRLAQLVPRLSGPTLIAALDKLQKSGDLDKVKNNLGKLIKDLNSKALFERYASGSTYSKLEKALGANTAALNAMDAAISTGDDTALNAQMSSFISKMSDKDIKEVKYNDIYSDSSDGKFGLSAEQKEKLQEALALAMLRENPGGMKSMLAGVNSSNYTRAHSAITRAISTIRTTDPVKADELGRSLEEMIKRRRMGDLDAGTTPPSASATGSPPPGGTTP